MADNDIKGKERAAEAKALEDKAAAKEAKVKEYRYKLLITDFTYNGNVTKEAISEVFNGLGSNVLDFLNSRDFDGDVISPLQGMFANSTQLERLTAAEEMPPEVAYPLRKSDQMQGRSQLKIFKNDENKLEFENLNEAYATCKNLGEKKDIEETGEDKVKYIITVMQSCPELFTFDTIVNVMAMKSEGMLIGENSISAEDAAYIIATINEKAVKGLLSMASEAIESDKRVDSSGQSISDLEREIRQTLATGSLSEINTLLEGIYLDPDTSVKLGAFLATQDQDLRLSLEAEPDEASLSKIKTNPVNYKMKSLLEVRVIRGELEQDDVSGLVAALGVRTLLLSAEKAINDSNVTKVAQYTGQVRKFFVDGHILAIKIILKEASKGLVDALLVGDKSLDKILDKENPSKSSIMAIINDLMKEEKINESYTKAFIEASALANYNAKLDEHKAGRSTDTTTSPDASDSESRSESSRASNAVTIVISKQKSTDGGGGKQKAGKKPSVLGGLPGVFVSFLGRVTGGAGAASEPPKPETIPTTTKIPSKDNSNSHQGVSGKDDASSTLGSDMEKPEVTHSPSGGLKFNRGGKDWKDKIDGTSGKGGRGGRAED